MSFVGYKLAQAVWGDDGLAFGAITTDLTYLPDDEARCVFTEISGGDCSMADGCFCGFYAGRDRRDLIEWKLLKPTPTPAQPVLLIVRLFGNVIEGEDGYRANRQQVIGVEVAGRCQTCGEETAGFRRGLGWSYGTWIHLEPACRSHSHMDLEAVSMAAEVPIWTVGDLPAFPIDPFAHKLPFASIVDRIQPAQHMADAA